MSGAAGGRLGLRCSYLLASPALLVVPFPVQTKLRDRAEPVGI